MLGYLIYLIIILIGIAIECIIFHLLVKKRLNESNSLLWIFIGFIVILSGVFPAIVVRVSGVLHITYPPALVFMVAIIILLFIILKNTINISELSAKVQETATEVSILQYEINELKAQLNDENNKIKDRVD